MILADCRARWTSDLANNDAYGILLLIYERILTPTQLGSDHLCRPPARFVRRRCLGNSSRPLYKFDRVPGAERKGLR